MLKNFETFLYLLVDIIFFNSNQQSFTVMCFSDAALQITSNIFLINGRTILKKNLGTGNTAEHHFRSIFGVDILLCVIVYEWINLMGLIPKVGKKTHFLLVCIQLMVYSTENDLAKLLDVSKKTFRKWSWIILLALSDLETDMVSF